jgi:HD-GYP domain-containing protein (c-di-GMP phosphodiesterase class II)
MKRDVNKKMLIRAGHLHDIGKLFISSEILNKPDKLTDDEFESVKAHPNSGAMILNGTSHKSISQIVALHHERVDGKGYYGVRRHDIPIESKIIAVADTFSALTTNRCYRQGFSVDDALDEIKRCSGTQFDERIVKCFLNIDISELRAASTTIKKYRAGV